MARKIHPSLEEGTFDERCTKAFDVRADIRELIENPDGTINPRALKEIAERNLMANVTVEKFAYGWTKRPSRWTMEHMAVEADALRRQKAGLRPAKEGEMILALVPKGTAGAIEL